MFKKIIIRVILLVAILVVFNAIYAKWFYPKDIEKYSSIIELVTDLPKETQVVYLGESSNITKRKDDIDRRKISEFIADYYPDIQLNDMTKSAAHAGIYKVLLEQIPDSSNVETIIVTLNLRSFNAQWIYSNLETALQKSLVLLRDNPPLVNRFMLSFKNYDIKSDRERQIQFSKKWKNDTFHLPYEFPYENVSEWNRAMSYKGVKGADGKKDWKMTELACHYIKGYGFQIDTLTNPRIKDFDDIVANAKKRGWNVVFNLMAENVEKADLLVGKDLTSMMYENAKLLNDYYTRKGVLVVNNLDLVEDEQFIDQHWTTEHYAEKGRKKIARNVALSLKDLYPEKFVEHENIQENIFYFDFDSPLKTIQSQKVSNEESFSGSQSLKIDTNVTYGVNLFLNANDIGIADKHELLVSFIALPQKISDQFKVVFEANGKDFKHWDGKQLSYTLKNIPQWQSYKTRFNIDESFVNAKQLKVYLLNTNNDVVFIDDLKIEFN